RGALADAACALPRAVRTALGRAAQHTFVLSVVPPLCALPPALFVTRGALRAALAAAQSCALCLFVRNAVATARGVRADLHDAQARAIVATLPHVLRHDERVLVRALQLVGKQPHALRLLPLLADGSGAAWRVALAALLAPLRRAQRVLIVLNAARGGGGGGAGASPRVTQPLLLRGRSVRDEPSSASSITAHALDAQLARDVAHACDALRALFVRGFKEDAFGVVQRTLPDALAALLGAHAHAALWLATGDERDRDHHHDARVINARNGAATVARWLVGGADERHVVRVVADCAARATYALLGRFETFAAALPDGREPAWDSALNAALAAFLRFDVP
ncbi:unnamed protein product, partial [Agarophyton chilense]